MGTDHLIVGYFNIRCFETLSMPLNSISNVICLPNARKKIKEAYGFKLFPRDAVCESMQRIGWILFAKPENYLEYLRQLQFRYHCFFENSFLEMQGADQK